VDELERGNRLRRALNEGPLLLDAGMGTRLIARGLQIAHDDPVLWNLSQPGAVLNCHTDDVHAGADAVYTNTFGAHRSRVAARKDLGRFDEVHKRAVELARRAAGPDRFVIGCLGPRDRSSGESASSQAAVGYAEEAAILSECGVDALVLETHEGGPALGALGILRQHSRLPVFVSLHDWPTGNSRRALAKALAQAGADAIGCNCVTDLERLVRLVHDLHDAVDLPLLVKPAGSNPRTNQSVAPADFARYVPDLVRQSVRLFGGCCGSTSEHIAALRRALGASVLQKHADR
jgi:methionine synthase I (cobalamin-dependent)